MSVPWPLTRCFSRFIRKVPPRQLLRSRYTVSRERSNGAGRERRLGVSGVDIQLGACRRDTRLLPLQCRLFTDL